MGQLQVSVKWEHNGLKLVAEQFVSVWFLECANLHVQALWKRGSTTLPCSSSAVVEMQPFGEQG